MLEGKIIYPCHRNVLVRLDKRVEKVGSLYVPETSRRASEWGVAAAKGPLVQTVNEEDRVFVTRLDGTHFEVAGEEYVMVDERKLLAIQPANINPQP